MFCSPDQERRSRVTGVLAGIPDHRDFFLSEEEHASNGVFTPCCSRALTASLTLDL